MAESHGITRPEPPLRRHDEGREITYTGSRAQLLEAAIIGPDDPLPGDAGQRKGYVKYSEDRRGIFIILRRPAGRFAVRVLRPEVANLKQGAESRGGEINPTKKSTTVRLVWSEGRPV
jgi:hypothetical protein